MPLAPCTRTGSPGAAVIQIVGNQARIRHVFAVAAKLVIPVPGRFARHWRHVGMDDDDIPVQETGSSNARKRVPDRFARCPESFNLCKRIASNSMSQSMTTVRRAETVMRTP